MKKLNYITILSLAAGLTFAGNAAADDQEYVYGIFDKADNFSIADGAWKTTNKSLFQAMGDEAVLTFTLVRNDTGKSFKFGTYTYEGGQIVDGRYVVPEGAKVDESSKKELQATTVDGKTVYITDKFSANDVVGLYIETDGKTTYFDPHYFDGVYHQTDEIDGRSYSDFFPVVNQLASSPWAIYNPGETDDPTGTYSLFYDTVGGYDGQFYYGAGNEWWQPSRNDFRFQVTGYALAASEPPVPPVGGPLPGVWATIALAGAASAYLKRRRKENK